MSNTLETVQLGTPVFVGATRVGIVRGVYGEGHSRQAEMLVVYWDARQEDVAVPASEVERVESTGISLLGTDVVVYSTLSTFDPARFPTVHPLS